MDETRDAGATVTAIGTGDMAYAEDFARERDVTFPLLVDRDLATYGIVRVRTGTATGLFQPSVVKGATKALLRGNLQGKMGRAPMLLGATHAILPDGTVPFAWINDDCGANAPIPQVLRALRDAAGGP